MALLPGTARSRRRIRTAFLGVVAFVALLWGAVDIVGVPPENLFRLLGVVVLGVGAVIVTAGVFVGLIQGIKRFWQR